RDLQPRQSALDLRIGQADGIKGLRRLQYPDKGAGHVADNPKLFCDDRILAKNHPRLFSVQRIHVDKLVLLRGEEMVSRRCFAFLRSATVEADRAVASRASPSARVSGP